ncbi:MAG: MBL fold metallo-hydrolase [Candidatus Aminicenantales bacterium]
MNRRFRKGFLEISLSLVFLTIGVLGSSIQASQTGQQSRPQPPPLTVEQVKGNIYQVKGGSGANTGFFIGEKEVLVIDAKMSEESSRQEMAEIQKLTPLPISFIILTHSDGDHVNGLNGFPPGTTIISHEDTRKYMAEAFKAPNFQALSAYLPDLTFSNQMTLYLGNEVIQILHFGPAHTSGDAVIYFPAEKVAFLGDLIFIGRDPLIHKHKNGCFSGALATLKAILKLDADTFVHGHGDIASRADIEALIQMYEEKQAKIKALIAEGKSLEEIKKIFNVEDRPAQPGRPQRPSFVEIIYQELTEKK